MLPGMTVINTCDFNQTKSATLEICNFDGPVYLRFGRPKVANFTNPSDKFQIGKGLLLNEGGDVTIVATGHLVWEAIQAAEKLHEIGINAEIINVHTIKPLDEDIILNSVTKTGCLVSAEEHNIYGGLGESVARLLTSKAPYPQEFVGTNDTFGESGTPLDLMNKYGLNSGSIIEAVTRVLKRKA